MTLSLAFHDAKAMVSFSLLGLQARSLAFNPLDSTGFSRRFPRFHLCLFGLVQWLLRVSEHLFFFSVLSVCASSSGFWAGLPVFLVCWHFCCLCLFAVYLPRFKLFLLWSSTPGSNPVQEVRSWVQLGVQLKVRTRASERTSMFEPWVRGCLGFHCDFLFPTQTCNSFCVLVRSCSFRPQEDLASLPFKFRAVHRPAFWVRNCRDFLPSVFGGPPECRKKLMVNTMWRLSLSPRVQHVEAALAC